MAPAVMPSRPPAGPRWGCELRTVPLTTDAPQEPPYSHDGHDADVV